MNDKKAVKVGDIFYNSWGYDQTNIDYYEVVRVTKSGKSVYIREIAQERISNNAQGMSAVVAPVAGKFIGPEMVKRVKMTTWKGDNNEVYLPAQYGWMGPYDGDPKTATYYA